MTSIKLRGIDWKKKLDCTFEEPAQKAVASNLPTEEAPRNEPPNIFFTCYRKNNPVASPQIVLDPPSTMVFGHRRIVKIKDDPSNPAPNTPAEELFPHPIHFVPTKSTVTLDMLRRSSLVELYGTPSGNSSNGNEAHNGNNGTDIHKDISNSIMNGITLGIKSTSEIDVSGVKSYVYISYCHTDRKVAELLYSHLVARNVNCWVDWHNGVADKEVTGEIWWQSICHGIAYASAFVFLMSVDSLSSAITLEELEFAFSLNKRIVPVVVNNLSDADSSLPVIIPPKLGKINWVFFRRGEDDMEVGIAEIVEATALDVDLVNEHTFFLVKAMEWRRVCILEESRHLKKDYINSHKDPKNLAKAESTTSENDGDVSIEVEEFSWMRYKKAGQRLLLKEKEFDRAMVFVRQCATRGDPIPTELHLLYFRQSRDQLSSSKIWTQVFRFIFVLITLGLISWSVYGYIKASSTAGHANDARSSSLMCAAVSGVSSIIADGTYTALYEQKCNTGLFMELYGWQKATTILATAPTSSIPTAQKLVNLAYSIGTNLLGIYIFDTRVNDVGRGAADIDASTSSIPISTYSRQSAFVSYTDQTTKKWSWVAGLSGFGTSYFWDLSDPNMATKIVNSAPSKDERGTVYSINTYTITKSGLSLFASNSVSGGSVNYVYVAPATVSTVNQTASWISFDFSGCSILANRAFVVVIEVSRDETVAVISFSNACSFIYDISALTLAVKTTGSLTGVTNPIRGSWFKISLPSYVSFVSFQTFALNSNGSTAIATISNSAFFYVLTVTKTVVPAQPTTFSVTCGSPCYFLRPTPKDVNLQIDNVIWDARITPDNGFVVISIRPFLLYIYTMKTLLATTAGAAPIPMHILRDTNLISSLLNNPLTPLAFSADGNYLGSTASDVFLRIWDIQPRFNIQSNGTWISNSPAIQLETPNVFVNVTNVTARLLSTDYSTSLDELRNKTDKCVQLSGVSFDPNWSPFSLYSTYNPEVMVGCEEGALRMAFPYWRISNDPMATKNFLLNCKQSAYTAAVTYERFVPSQLNSNSECKLENNY